MSSLELVIWSMALGAIGIVVAGRLVDLLLHPGAAGAQALAFHFTVLLFVGLLCGVAEELLPTLDQRGLRVAQVLAGPLCTGLSNFWIRNWFAAAQRDRFMWVSLQVSALLTPLLGIACLALPAQHQLPAAALLCLVNGTLTLSLALRAWLLGDRLAPVMSVGCLFTLPAIVGLYALAMKLPGLGPEVQAFFALSAALCNAQTGFVLWRRARHDRRARRQEAGNSQFDVVTKLYSGTALVQRLIAAQQRRQRMRRDGAVVAMMVFDLERIVTQAGTAGANEMFIVLAMRMQRQLGVVNPVGRYYDRCYVGLVEAIHSPAWLRTLGLRVATSLRRPIEVVTMDGNRIELRPDIGVGVVHLSRQRADVEDILHDAEAMAVAARGMRSRAAMLDPVTGEIVPVELAELGAHRPHRVAPTRRFAKTLQYSRHP